MRPVEAKGEEERLLLLLRKEFSREGGNLAVIGLLILFTFKVPSVSYKSYQIICPNNDFSTCSQKGSSRRACAARIDISCL